MSITDDEEEIKPTTKNDWQVTRSIKRKKPQNKHQQLPPETS